MSMQHHLLKFINQRHREKHKEPNVEENKTHTLMFGSRSKSTEPWKVPPKQIASIADEDAEGMDCTDCQISSKKKSKMKVDSETRPLYVVHDQFQNVLSN
ncbi:hypothetical protein ACHQM5_001984 [Ranunculus cassubicifolius]